MHPLYFLFRLSYFFRFCEVSVNTVSRLAAARDRNMFSIYQDTFVAAFVAYVVALVCIEYNLPIRRPSDSKWALIIIISFLMVAIYGLQVG